MHDDEQHGDHDDQHGVDQPASAGRAVPTPRDDLIASDDNGRRAPFVPSDNTTLTAVLHGFDGEGYGTHFFAVDGAAMRCGGCGAVSPAVDFEIDAIRRLEGASEPDEMVAVVAATCPHCGRRGVAVLGYGPSSSPEDTDVSAALRHVL